MAAISDPKKSNTRLSHPICSCVLVLIRECATRRRADNQGRVEEGPQEQTRWSYQTQEAGT